MALFDDVTLYLSNILSRSNGFVIVNTGGRATFAIQKSVNMPLSSDMILMSKTIEIIKNSDNRVEFVLWYRQLQGRSGQPFSVLNTTKPKKLYVGVCTSMPVFLLQFASNLLAYLVEEETRLEYICSSAVKTAANNFPPFQRGQPVTSHPVRLIHRTVRGKYLQPYSTIPVPVRDDMLSYSASNLLSRNWNSLNPLERVLTNFYPNRIFTVVDASDSTGLIIGEALSRNVKNSVICWLGGNANGYYTLITRARSNTYGTTEKSIVENSSSFTIEDRLCSLLQSELMYNFNHTALRLPHLRS